MHCWKTINIEYEYGTTRLVLFSTITFFLVFCFSYVGVSHNFPSRHHDDYFIVFFLALFALYPLHKLIHYIALLDYRKKLAFRWRIQYRFIPVLHMRLKDTIPKNRYVFALLAPFLFLNSLLLVLAVNYTQYAHYTCILLGLHCSICFIDLLNVKNLWNSPPNAVIEETPKGYEILVPPNM
ncbi:DUF3267 domain-containing protein [Solibacillus sp. CAU 1738]|uniref:DUF3267 domain-containing protein n=1 Tax=Solibacillus sp. CAU 1738 TaxID=3140363 RepID=UPI0032604F2D